MIKVVLAYRRNRAKLVMEAYCDNCGKRLYGMEAMLCWAEEYNKKKVTITGQTLLCAGTCASSFESRKAFPLSWHLFGMKLDKNSYKKLKEGN